MTDQPDEKKIAHLLYIRSIDEEFRVDWSVTCPWEPNDQSRDCLYGMEPMGPCLWDAYERELHHPMCEDEELCDQLEPGILDGDETWPCWEREPRTPNDCEGFMSIEGDHLHPVDGCGLMEAVGWGGFGDSVYLTKVTDHPPHPVPVKMTWEEGGASLEVVE